MKNIKLKKRASHIGRARAQVIHLVDNRRANQLSSMEDALAKAIVDIRKRRVGMPFKARLRMHLAIHGILTDTLNELCKNLPPEMLEPEPPLPEDIFIPAVLRLPVGNKRSSR